MLIETLSPTAQSTANTLYMVGNTYLNEHMYFEWVKLDAD